MTSPLPADDPQSPRRDALPALDQSTVARYIRQEAAVYAEVGDFVLTQPPDLGTAMLTTWLDDVALSSPERRRAALETLALYALSAADATGGLPLTAEQETAVVSAIAATGPLQADREHAARDAIALLRSGADPAAQLPDTWDIYSHALPDAFTAACLVLAVLTLETVREVAAADQADPGDLWRDWVASNQGT